jgi:hypothetical protein
VANEIALHDAEHRGQSGQAEALRIDRQNLLLALSQTELTIRTTPPTHEDCGLKCCPPKSKACKCSAQCICWSKHPQANLPADPSPPRA